MLPLGLRPESAARGNEPNGQRRGAGIAFVEGGVGSGLPRWDLDPLSIFVAQGASQEEGSRGPPGENSSVFTICDFTFGVAEALGQSRLPALGRDAPNVVDLGLDRRAVDHPEILDPRLCGEIGGGGLGLCTMWTRLARWTQVGWTGH